MLENQESKRTSSKVDSRQKTSLILLKLGKLFVGISLVIFLIAFYPVIFEEIKYTFFRPNKKADVVIYQGEKLGDVSKNRNVIEPIDTDFGLVIPKIGANSRVVANVNPYDSRVYQRALTLGVAHAQGTVFPGQIGNTFIFSHSSVNFYEANRFNSVFYLLNKVSIGDEFYIAYKGELFKYVVRETSVVNPEAVEYLEGSTTKKTATLMTCWPAGTTLKRLVVVGELVGD